MSSHYRESKYKIYLGYSESESGGEVCAGEDPSYAYASREDAYMQFTPEGLYTEAGSMQETIGVDFDPKEHVGDDAYMVLVRYFDGNTFGRTNGYWYVEGVYLEKETAQDLA